MKSLIALLIIVSTFAPAQATRNPNQKLNRLLHEVVTKDKNGNKAYKKAKKNGLNILRFFCHNGTDAPEKECQKDINYFICPDNKADLCFNFRYNTADEAEIPQLIYDALLWYNKL